MVEGGAEILTERRCCNRIVRREEHGQHEEEAEEACGTHENAENERYPDRQFTVSHEEGDGCSVRKNKTTQNGRQEGVSPTLEKFDDPELEAAVKRRPYQRLCTGRQSRKVCPRRCGAEREHSYCECWNLKCT